MSDEWIKYKKAPGIYYREHPDRKVKGRTKDRYWRLFYKYEGKNKPEILGWESEGWPEAKVVEISAGLAGNRRKGLFPGTYAELQSENKKARAEREAAAKEREEEAARAAAATKTFAEVFPMYLEERKTVVYNERTFRDEKSKGFKWLIPYFGHLTMSEISVSHIEKFIKECKNPTKKILEYGKREKAIPKPRTPQTIKHYINLLSQVWEWAKKNGFCAGDNPARAAEVKKATPQKKVHRSRFLTKEEVETLFPLLKERSLQLWAKCSFMLYCGLRPVEVHALTWGDVDEINMIINVEKQLDTNKGKSRHIPFTNKIADVLEKIRPEICFPTSLVFPPKTIRKEGVQRSGEISDVFEDVVNSLGWNDGVEKNNKILPYSLRHTYASWLVQKGVDLYTVAALLGHSTIEVTKRYAHLSPDNLRAAVDQIF